MGPLDWVYHLAGSVRACPNCNAIMTGESHNICGYIAIPEILTIEKYFGCELGDVSEELRTNAKRLLVVANSLLAACSVLTATQTSGYRNPEYNRKIGGAENSKHCKALAIDLLDNDRKLGNFVALNVDLLRSRGMAMEDLSYCIKKDGEKWVHWQLGTPPSGKLIFVPYPGPPRLTE